MIVVPQVRAASAIEGVKRATFLAVRTVVKGSHQSRDRRRNMHDGLHVSRSAGEEIPWVEL